MKTYLFIVGVFGLLYSLTTTPAYGDNASTDQTSQGSVTAPEGLLTPTSVNPINSPILNKVGLYPNGGQLFIDRSVNVPTITVSTITVSNIITVPNGVNATDAAAFGQIVAAKVFQIVSVTNAVGVAQTGQTTLGASNLTGSITPTSASHHVLVIISGTLRIASATVAHRGVATIMRGGSVDTSGGAFLGEVYEVVSNVQTTVPCTMSIVDAPGTNSSISYAAYIATPDSSSDTVTWSPNNSMASLIMIEVP